jgi:predicted branched-subunit amino acid permease
MTAMFVVILLEQILGGKRNIPSVLIGVLTSVLCLFVFKPSSFIIPSMAAIAIMLLLLRKPISKLNGEVA